ncbi:MAG TPA: alpha/beta hydrolase-fold protein [Tepidisphaeraceae bacterium]|nr:alpha/beta hydrolase-fold protein [Tepidisphaeraceae bacterium]
MRYVIWPLVLIAIGISGFAGWYLAQSDAEDAEVARAKADEYVQWASTLRPVPVKFVVKAPADTPKDQTLYLSGSAPSLKAWAADGVPLQRQADGTYTATLDGDLGLLTGLTHEFKVTRGNWATVETDQAGAEAANHTFTIEPKMDEATVEVSVASWRDKGQSVPGKSTRTGNIVVHRKFHSDELKNDRDIYVYLPPGYDDPANAEKRYPVLYMQDGQNLMDADVSFNGIEWQVDETAERMITSGKIDPVIIVGINNGGEFRAQEFTPDTMASADAPAQAGIYGKLVCDQIKPMIDNQYRTLPDAPNTFIAGSSLGGLVTLSIVKAAPDSFGGVALLTPWLQLNDKPISAALGEDLSFLKGKKLWIDTSDKPGDNYPAGKDPVADTRAFAAKLTAAGMAADKDFVFKEFAGQGHDEIAWQKRIDQVLLYLFGK